VLSDDFFGYEATKPTVIGFLLSEPSFAAPPFWLPVRLSATNEFVKLLILEVT